MKNDNLTCVIVDDNPQCISVLKSLLNKYFPEVEVLGEANSVATGVGLLKSLQPNILFLDVEMPTENGTTLFEYIANPSFETIFTTAFRDYAAEAFRLGSIDYLVKPVKPSDLKEAIEKVQTKKSLIQQSGDAILKDYSQTDKITFSHVNAIEVYAIEDILFCQAESNYTIVHGINKKSMVSKTLGYYETLLKPYGFFRINRSHLVNVKHVEKVDKANGEVYLNKGINLLLSSRRRKEFIDMLSGISD